VVASLMVAYSSALWACGWSCNNPGYAAFFNRSSTTFDHNSHEWKLRELVQYFPKCAEAEAAPCTTWPVAPPPGEPNRWFARFESYRLAGPRRSLSATWTAEQAEKGRKKRSKVPGSWNEAATGWRWRQRVEAWDEHERQKAREGAVVDALLSGGDGAVVFPPGRRGRRPARHAPARHVRSPARLAEGPLVRRGQRSRMGAVQRLAGAGLSDHRGGQLHRDAGHRGRGRPGARPNFQPTPSTPPTQATVGETRVGPRAETLSGGGDEDAIDQVFVDYDSVTAELQIC